MGDLLSAPPISSSSCGVPQNASGYDESVRLRDDTAAQDASALGRALRVVGAVAVVAGVAVALIPFSATYRQSVRLSAPDGHAIVSARSYACAVPLAAWRQKSSDGGLLRGFFRGLSRQSGGATTRPTAPRATPGATASADIARLNRIFASAERHAACQPAAAHRLLAALVLGLVGAALLAWWWLRLPPKYEPGDPPDAAGPRFRYQPALDGLRAISILLVLTRHAGLRGLFVSGDHGVDIFFVLSGFLITTLLLEEHRSSGHIGLGRFYVRRVLRLYPVVLVLLAVGALVLIVDPSFPTAPHWSGLAATSFYYANWFHNVNPLAQGFLAPTWSLAIEEQFYLVWPPIVVLLLARGRGRWGLAVVAGTGAALAAIYRAAIWQPALGKAARGLAGVVHSHVRFDAYNSWYFNSFARADTILVGCLLAAALTPAAIVALRARPALVSRVAWIAAVVAVYICLRETILGSRLEDAPGARYGNADFVPIWGLVAFEVSIALVILGLVVLPRSRMASGLSNRAFVWTGKRSYGLYVLHAPIYDAFDHFKVVHGYYLPMVVKIGASFVAAAMSYRFVEAPALRLKDRYAGRLASRRETSVAASAGALSNAGD